MRIIPTLLLAYVVLAVQSGLAPFIAVRGASPNLMLPIVIFVALYAPRETALVGVYVLGLMQDVLSQEPLGLHPLVYAAVAFATRATQPALQRNHWLTQVILAVAGAVLHALALWLAGWRMPPRPTLDVLANAAIYTAVLTPLILRGLGAMRGVFVVPQIPRALRQA